ncbi:hypothetical protein Ae406Ps2_3394c [Pseudonocardia sp. Ae406_Ps2]|nr:hypothetical protein Ae331Ps2_2528 [Pseudonocardia sp. Ae331_Ps2]OLM03394.1 hypothetical protein Ae406Ps2_3394c [Pseudonocardia sp. Ae406_Ps2]OLM11712.1 hypothetical protein Ae505Ps2_1837 [Pseudonocardia sp. Ae505_Ps2]
MIVGDPCRRAGPVSAAGATASGTAATPLPGASS